ncbi:hypothetical protein RJ55_06172 [Drechmeria coniospora]|nr:hypothetical protein RJ55_06172 [Drechmeria coniospora]
MHTYSCPPDLLGAPHAGGTAGEALEQPTPDAAEDSSFPRQPRGPRWPSGRSVMAADFQDRKKATDGEPESVASSLEPGTPSLELQTAASSSEPGLAGGVEAQGAG